MSDTNTCGCGKAASSCDSSTSTSTSTKASSGAIQNGKGDAPRNISTRFRKNYDGIRWESSRRAKRQEGVKFVKAY